jgi:AcrR family transcriptional regulator
MPAKQDRSRRTRAALLDALDALLHDRSFEDIGVAEIAARAGVSAASIYRRFSKKEGLLAALYELQLKRVAEWNEQDWVKRRLAETPAGDAPLRAVLTCHVELAVRQLRDLSHLARPMAIYARMKPDLFGDEVDPLLSEARAGVLALLKVYPETVRRTNLDQASRMLVYLMQSSLNDFVLFDDRTMRPLAGMSDQTFARQIADFAFGYLTTSDGPDLSA